MVPLPIYLLLLFLIKINPSYGDQGTLSQGQTLKDSDHLYSANKTFMLRFFSISSQNRYLGIFYCLPDDPSSKYDYTLVWIANRNNPVPGSSGSSLSIDAEDGLLKISYAGGTFPISNNPAAPPVGANFSATLLDNGNFVLNGLNSDGSMNSTVWQSFDYPTDTLLPGMKIGSNFRTGHNWSLNSWTNMTVPAEGMFTLSMDPNGAERLIVWRNGTVYWTTGLFRNGKFDNFSLPDCYNFTYTSNADEKYFEYTLKCKRVDSTALGLNYYGGIDFGEKTTQDDCPLPLNEGCTKQNLSTCGRGPRDRFWFRRRDGYSDTFYGKSYIFPEVLNLNLSQCRAKCLEACSCVAFASRTEDGSGCELWSELSYMKSDVSKTPWRRTVYTFQAGPAPKKKWKTWLITCVVGAVLLSSVVLLYCIIKRRKFRISTGKTKEGGNELKQLSTTESMVSERSNNEDKNAVRVFSLDDIEKATDNFSEANKLGEGGFGPVYKGKLPGGQDIAVKRRSINSGQGLLEFKNEVVLIAKLQHINLVRLLGSCIQGPEKILVYEYMPNKSLDHFLFDCEKQELLNWTVRKKIIEGIAQGLLYLHKYSRLKVIHRDLKAGNILLDHDMNPKISDFGMARIFEGPESEANTKRIVGTYGYMSPEYIINGVVSLKTDVFSFGVLLLEIISGKKNLKHYDTNQPLNLVGLAWKLWDEGRAVDVADSTMHDHLSHKNEVIKCINIGLLCVQDNPNDRPSMMDVVSMLANVSVRPSIPKRPAFFFDGKDETGNNTMFLKMHSINGLSLTTLVEGR